MSALPQAPAQVQLIPISQLVEWQNCGHGQPRKHFDPAALQDLADSIRQGGFLGSIAVRPCPGRPGYYEILAGHRRTRAAALAHLEAVPATVHDLDDQAARWYVLQDNLQRQDFLPWEEGDGYAELLDGGTPLAVVAGRVGKSPSLISTRVEIARNLCERARELYLRHELTLQALELLAGLPDESLSPVQCPRCRVVCHQEATACPACGADLTGVFRVPSGNPQQAAALLCRGRQNGAVEEIVARVQESYGLGAEPVQTSLGLDDVQISEEAVAVRTELERRLAQVAAAGQYFLRHRDRLAEYTPDQRAAIAAQCNAAETWLRVVREAAVPPAAAPATPLTLAI